MDPDFYNNLADQLGLKTEIGRKALVIALDNIQTLDRKQQDYGSQNIARHGELGVLVRCDDKTARLQNLLKNRKTMVLADNPAECQMAPRNESILDSWLDLANYGIIGAMCHLGEWK
jgi:hypothetical protein